MLVKVWIGGGDILAKKRDIKVFTSSNFKLEGMTTMTTNSDYLNRPDVKLDERLNMLNTGWDTSTFDWYYNYLEANQIIASKNANAYCNYLLDLGYIPIVYLPSPAVGLSSQFMKVLDASAIPYVKMGPTSFASRYCHLDTIDAWVSKMDAAKFLGCSPEAVRSADLFRRCLNG